VALELDINAPIRSASRQRELVEAIYKAPASEQETEWLEWKTEVDLKRPRWRAEIARQVLGMANRDPSTAAQWADGCGFILLGVAPGQWVGSPVYDNAQIEDWLIPYVGRSPNAPQWASSYVSIDDKDVLLITVEAPRQGDPIWPCRSSYMADVDHGEQKSASVYERVYVRHRAKTVEANSDDYQMLSTRAAGASVKRLTGVAVEVGGGSAVCIDHRADTVDAWLQTERRRLEPPVDESAHASDPTALDTRALAGVSQFLDLVGSTDTRSRVQYDKEVDAYLAEADKYIALFMMAEAQRRELGRVRIAVRNNTDEPINGLQVKVTISASNAWAVESNEFAKVSFPTRPAEFGAVAPRSNYLGLDPLSYANLLGQKIVPIGRGISIRHEEGQGYIVTYDQIDLLARSSHTFDEMYVFATNVTDAGGTLEATWEARAKSLSHVLPGTLAIPVSSVVPSIDELRTATAVHDYSDEEP